MPYNYSNITRQRANINGNNFLTGGGGNCRSSIGGNAFIRHVKNINTGPASDKKLIFAINQLGGVGTMGSGHSRMFGPGADGVNLATIQKQILQIKK